MRATVISIQDNGGYDRRFETLTMNDELNVVLSLGSNCGDRESAVAEAAGWLSRMLDGFSCSDIYETRAIGHDGPDYMNAVVIGSTKLTLAELEASCKAYELSHGRDEQSRREKRVPVDIDIVMANSDVLRPRDFSCGFFRKGYLSLNVAVEN